MHKTQPARRLSLMTLVALLLCGCGRGGDLGGSALEPSSVRMTSGYRVVRSVGGSSGSSFLFSSNNRAPVVIPRGISLRAWNGKAEFTLASFDPCAGGADGDFEGYSFAQDIRRYKSHFSTFVIVVSDSATCGPTDLSPLFAGSGLQQWRSIAFRTPYIATITNGVISEYTGGRDESVDAIISGPVRKKEYTQRSLSALPMVAHGGGGIGNISYTNSLDALNFNRDKFDLFEIDFSWTSDGKLVCLHDWDHSYKRSFGLEPDGAKTLAEYENLVATHSAFKKCTLDNLVGWLRSNPGKRIVTDVKENNIAALEELKRIYPDMVPRFIPQVYQPAEYYAARDLGYDDIIWTLYIYPGGTREVLDHLAYMDLYGLTISRTRARGGLGQEAFDSTGVLSWTHTVNTESEAMEMRGRGVASIYTDFLAPATGGGRQPSATPSVH